MGYQPRKPKEWMAKSPPEPFYGPDDYYHGMNIELAMQEADMAITRWHEQYKNLSMIDKIRLAVSNTGCKVAVK